MSKHQNRRIFGMSTFQVAVLLILAFIAVVVIFGGFIYISSAGQPSGTTFFPTAVPPDLSPPELPAAPAEISDLPPEATFIPNDAPLPADWKNYSNARIELWLPPQFESTFPDQQRQERIVYYRQQGYEFLAADLEQENFDYNFWFNFPQPDSVVYKTSVIVRTDILPSDTLDEYVDQVYGAGLPGFGLVGSEVVDFADFEARRVLLTTDLGGFPVGVADYVITDEINLWVIRCGSDLEVFYTWLPEFDRIARSLRLVN
jgi:hypothetical protein